MLAGFCYNPQGFVVVVVVVVVVVLATPRWHIGSWARDQIQATAATYATAAAMVNPDP